MPEDSGVSLAFTWIETKRSAPFALANAVRPASETYESPLRVRSTRSPGSTRRSRAATARAIASVIRFSSMPPGPEAPGSLPPCPGSSTTTRWWYEPVRRAGPTALGSALGGSLAASVASVGTGVGQSGDNPSRRPP